MSGRLDAPLLEVEHVTRYRYAAPVDLAQHLAHLCPREDAMQSLQTFELQIDPAPLHQSSAVDRLGNSRTCFTVTTPHRELCVRATSRVRVAPDAGFDAAATQHWEGVRDRLRYAAGAAYEPASEFVFASPLVPLMPSMPSLPTLRELAAPSFAPGTPVASAAIDLMARINADFTYRSESTEVDTPLTEVLVTREGVCQDFAHLMIGALRSLGLAARYVSGYLLTSPPESGASMKEAAPLLGADASHAWVAVWCPMSGGQAARWLELDPTNKLLPGAAHIRLAIGRDYSDVAPLRGVIRGGGEHRLEVRVRTSRLA